MSLKTLISLGGWGVHGSRKFSVLGFIQLVEVKHEFHDIIKWNKPNKLKLWDPQKTCDIKSLPKVDPNALKLEYRPFAHIIEKLPEDDRKLFTMALGSRKDWTNIIMEDTLSLVKRHKYDNKSPEFKVAKLTIQIRNYQAIFEENFKFGRGMMKTQCKEAIQKRHKHLTWLKLYDIKKFEWILVLLGIIFKANPEVFEHPKRKTAVSKLTEMYCTAIRSQRLFEYKLELESQKISFLEEKLTTLEKIKADEDTMRIPCSVEEDIQETIQRLENMKTNPVEIKPVEQLELVPSYQVPDNLYRIGQTKNSVRY